MKKFISLFLSVSLALLLLSACGSEEGGSSVSSTPPSGSSQGGSSQPEVDPADIAEIVVAFWNMNQVPSDMQMVSDAISEITVEKIGVRVTLNIMDVGNYMQQIPLMVSSGEKLDLFATFAAAAPHFSNMSAQGQLLDITDLLSEYGQGVANAMPSDDYLAATTVNGRIYAAPVVYNKVNSLYWYCRKSQFDQLDIDISDIAGIRDIEKVFAKAKEVFPSMMLLSGNAKTLNTMYVGTSPLTGNYFDVMGDQNVYAAAVPYAADGTTDYKVVNYYDTDEYRENVEMVKRWHDLGYTDKDMANKDIATNPLQDPAVFSAFFGGNAQGVSNLDASVGEEVVTVKIQDGAMATGPIIQMTWAIPVSSDEPEAAMKYMNLMYTDPDIVNLMDFGIEGVHYEWTDKGTIDFLPGQDASSSGYYPSSSAFIGNVFLSHPWGESDPNIMQILRDELDTAIYSPLVGFSLNLEPVNDIYTLLSTMIVDEYRPALNCGNAPDGYLEELLAKMQAAGMDEYIAEAQGQLDAWLATR